MTKRIRDGKLFKNVSPFIRSINAETLEAELLLVKRSCASDVNHFFGFNPDGDTLQSAFSWAVAPQGDRFWSALHAEFEENTEICYVPN